LYIHVVALRNPANWPRVSDWWLAENQCQSPAKSSQSITFIDMNNERTGLQE